MVPTPSYDHPTYTQLPCPVHSGGKLSREVDIRRFLSFRRVPVDETDNTQTLKAKVLASWNYMPDWDRYRYVEEDYLFYTGTYPCPVHNGGSVSLVADMKRFLRWRGFTLDGTEGKPQLKAAVVAAWASMCLREQLNHQRRR
jgi:hypothetical protein